MIYVGTSGYSYKHWKNLFYPEGLRPNEWLKFYSTRFKSLELNNTFYRLPSEAAISSWYRNTPEDFIFAAKGSRYLTHSKRMLNPEGGVKKYLDVVAGLREKLGVVLWQLPADAKVDLLVFENFCHLLADINPGLRHAFEFRSDEWFREEVYASLKKFNYALCISDSVAWPKSEVITANFTYVRLHGPGGLYGSVYREDQLKEWSDKIENYSRKVEDIYVYFNNDAFAYAPRNAQELTQLLRAKNDPHLVF
jgi:uncharacterized protein YecE (DUF72 family)